MAIKEYLSKWEEHTDLNNFKKSFHISNSAEGLELKLNISFRNNLINYPKTITISPDYTQIDDFVETQLKEYSTQFLNILKEYLDINWNNTNKELPEIGERVELVFGETMSTLNPTTFYTEYTFTFGIFNGTDFVIEDEKTSHRYSRNKQFCKINYWSYL